MNAFRLVFASREAECDKNCPRILCRELEPIVSPALRQLLCYLARELGASTLPDASTTIPLPLRPKRRIIARDPENRPLPAQASVAGVELIILRYSRQPDLEVWAGI